MFKVRSDDGAFRGGPAFYIQRGLRSRTGGVAYAVLLMVAFSTAFNMVETNAVSGVLKSSHGIDIRWTTVVLAVLAAPVLFGGVRRVAAFAGIGASHGRRAVYTLLALAIVAVNITELPGGHRGDHRRRVRNQAAGRRFRRRHRRRDAAPG